MTNIESGEKNIAFFRHGKSYYNQGSVPISEVNDLFPEAIEEIKYKSHELSVLLKDRNPSQVVVLSSPLARTLQTAQVIADTLEENSLKVKHWGKDKDQKVYVVENLTDQKNFSWSVQQALVNGGKIEYEGVIFNINPLSTNPKKLTLYEYTSNDVDQIPYSVKQIFPEKFLDGLNRIEKNGDLNIRTNEIIRKISSSVTRNTFYILVTHDAIIRTALHKELKPGQYAILGD